MDILLNFLQWVRGGIFVEVAIKGDFITDLDFAVINPGIRAIGQDFGFEIGSTVIPHQGQQIRDIHLGRFLLASIIEGQR